uniref:Uncharacterized protein n=1 Tax=Anguilla anguilla TaxID=7936 RepID=A0A0E9UL42_ANGAN
MSPRGSGQVEMTCENDCFER